jgi:hypothetical protein
MWAHFQELKIIEFEAKFEECKRLWLLLVQQYLSLIIIQSRMFESVIIIIF